MGIHGSFEGLLWGGIGLLTGALLACNDGPEPFAIGPEPVNQRDNADAESERRARIERRIDQTPPPVETKREHESKDEAVERYKRELLAWFNARWHIDQADTPCVLMRRLRVAIEVSVKGTTITAARAKKWSGNQRFDRAAAKTMRSWIGEKLPRPPPSTPDILGDKLYPTLSGERMKCQGS